MDEEMHELNFGEQKMFTVTERILHRESTVGTKIQSGVNVAFKGHGVTESENIRAGKGLRNCLAQPLHLRVEKMKALKESVLCPR